MSLKPLITEADDQYADLCVYMSGGDLYSRGQAKDGWSLGVSKWKEGMLIILSLLERKPRTHAFYDLRELGPGKDQVASELLISGSKKIL